MGKQPVASVELEPQLLFCSLELGDWRYIRHRCWTDNANRLPDPPLHLHLVHPVLRTVRIDPVCGRTLCIGLDPVSWAGPVGQNLLREHDGLPVLGPAVRNPPGTYDGTADHQPDAVQWIVYASVCRLQPSHRYERGECAAVHHGRPDPIYRKSDRSWRHRRDPDDCDQWS